MRADWRRVVAVVNKAEQAAKEERGSRASTPRKRKGERDDNEPPAWLATMFGPLMKAWSQSASVAAAGGAAQPAAAPAAAAPAAAAPAFASTSDTQETATFVGNLVNDIISRDFSRVPRAEIPDRFSSLNDLALQNETKAWILGVLKISDDVEDTQREAAMKFADSVIAQVPVRCNIASDGTCVQVPQLDFTDMETWTPKYVCRLVVEAHRKCGTPVARMDPMCILHDVQRLWTATQWVQWALMPQPRAAERAAELDDASAGAKGGRPRGSRSRAQ